MRLTAKQIEVLHLVESGTPWFGVSDLSDRRAGVKVAGRRRTLGALYARRLVTLPGRSCRLTDEGKQTLVGLKERA